MKRYLLPAIKVFSILFVPGVIPVLLATFVVKKNKLKPVRIKSNQVNELS